MENTESDIAELDKLLDNMSAQRKDPRGINFAVF